MLNEEQLLEGLFNVLLPILRASDCQSFEIICIDDGSTDQTYQKLEAWAQKTPTLRLIRFTRNFGKEAALLAGFQASSGDVVIPMDADLQDPPHLIPNFLSQWSKGYDVVLGRRTDRSLDSFLKRITAQLFYRFLSRLSKVPLFVDVGDFMLLDRKVVDSLLSLPEFPRYTRGLIAWLGYPSTPLPYKRPSRHSGTTKHTPWKVLTLGITGMVGFTQAPLQLGFPLCTTAIASAIITYSLYWLGKVDEASIFSSLLIHLLLAGGFLAAGGLGLYIGKILELKQGRPAFILRESLRCMDKQKMSDIKRNDDKGQYSRG